MEHVLSELGHLGWEDRSHFTVDVPSSISETGIACCTLLHFKTENWECERYVGESRLLGEGLLILGRCSILYEEVMLSVVEGCKSVNRWHNYL
jgi:hypothetical protein